MICYPRFIGDYQRDTSRLSLAEHGAYNLLLDELYATEQPLPENSDELYRICRAFLREEKHAVDNVIKRFFKRTPDGFIQERAWLEIGKKADQRAENKRIALDREANKRARAVARNEHEPLHESCTKRATSRSTKRSTKTAPSLTINQIKEVESRGDTPVDNFEELENAEGDDNGLEAFETVDSYHDTGQGQITPLPQRPAELWPTLTPLREHLAAVVEVEAVTTEQLEEVYKRFGEMIELTEPGTQQPATVWRRRFLGWAKRNPGGLQHGNGRSGGKHNGHGKRQGKRKGISWDEEERRAIEQDAANTVGIGAAVSAV